MEHVPDAKVVFVSYAGADEAIVAPIVARLRKNRFNVWTMRENPPGARYPEKIEELIQACGVFVVMASRQSATSRDVRQEVHLAFSADRRIVKVVIDPKAKDAFEYQTKSLVRVDLPQGAEDPEFPRLVKGIDAWNPGRRRAKPQARGKAMEDLAWLLPHLVDRTSQEQAIKEYVAAALTSGEGRPGIFFLQGREAECGDVFVRRVAIHTVPAVASGVARFHVHLDQATWPDHRDDLDDPREAARARADALLASARNAVSRVLQNRSQAAVFRVELPLEEWRRSDTALLQEFVGWWRDGHPSLAVAGPVIILVHASHGEGLIEPWVRRLRLRSVEGFFSPLRHAPPARVLTCLPVLRGVTRTHAKDWIHTHLKELRYSDPLDAATAIAPHFRSRLFFGRPRLPMAQAVEALRRLLRDETPRTMA
jgi:hypothetical protein